MILTIVLLWSLGVAALICVAVVRGRKKGPKAKQSDDPENGGSERVLIEIRALQAQVAEMDRKLSQGGSAAEVEPQALSSQDWSDLDDLIAVMRADLAAHNELAARESTENVEIDPLHPLWGVSVFIDESDDVVIHSGAARPGRKNALMPSLKQGASSDVPGPVFFKSL